MPGRQPDRVLALAGQGREGGARRPAGRASRSCPRAPCSRPWPARRSRARIHTRSTCRRRPCGGCRTRSPRSGGRCRRPGARCRSASRPGRGRRGPRLAAGEPQHRLDEVVAADPEEAGRADDEVALVGGRDGLLAGQLGAAVGRERRRLVALDVGRALGAVEDVVGGDVDDAAPTPAAAAATLPAPAPLTAKAASSASSAPSTSVQAALLMTMSGRSRSNFFSTAPASVTSSSRRPKPTTSWPALPAASIRSRPSIPAAPVTRTFIDFPRSLILHEAGTG